MCRYSLIVVVLIISSCSSHFSIVGNYADKKSNDEFKFNKDSTFQYQYGYLEYYLHSEGRWKKKAKDTVELSSNIPDVSLPYTIEVADTNTKKDEFGLLINLIIKNGLPPENYICRVIINKTKFFNLRCDTVLYFPINSMDEIAATFMFIKFAIGMRSTSLVTDALIIPDLHIRPQKGKTIILNTTIDDQFFYYKPFNKTLVKVGCNYIEYYEKQKQYHQKIAKTKKHIEFLEMPK